MKTNYRKCFTAVLAVTAGSLGLAPAARAITINPTSDPYVTGSWAVNVDIIGFAFFDSFEAFIVPGSDTGAGPFESPGISNIFDYVNVAQTWTGSLVNPTYLAGSGDLTFALNADLHFLGDLTGTVALDWLFYNSVDFPGDVVDSIRLSYIPDLDGDAATPSAFDFELGFVPEGIEYNREPAGVPDSVATIYLLGLAVISMAGVRRRIPRLPGC